MADPGSTLVSPPSPSAADAIAAEAARVEPKVGASEGGVSLSNQLSSIVELTKPRITKLVVITSGMGFALAAIGANKAQLHGGWRTQDLVISALGCIVGTALSSAGAGSFNMWWERRRDSQMPRTAKRPLPTGRLSPAAAFTVGMLLSVLGVLLLSILCGPAPALVSLATIILYILVYTPLKTMTTLNTIVGAVPGALPPLIGWTAGAVGGLWTPMFGGGGGGGIATSTEASLASLADPAGWSLVVLMTVWQIPHFLALAWMYRDDYARGGYRMLPLEDADGRATMTTIIVWALTLLPATLAPALTMTDRLGALYVSVAAVSGVAFVVRCMVLVKARTRDNARRVFLASIMHLPLILLVMVADALLHAWGVLGEGGGSAS